jgi:CAAX prenyl protease-like protein
MPGSSGLSSIFQQYRWIPFVLPLAVFMLVGSLEPTPAASGGTTIGLSIPYSAYPWVYTAKIALALAALLIVRPGLREFPVRVTPLGVLVGLAGALVWIGLTRLHLEDRILNAVGLGNLAQAGVRSAFNPFEQLAGHPVWAWGFLAVRFFGLVVVISIAEELFLRGLMMRFFVDPDWWKVPFGQVNAAAVIVGTVLPMLSHPHEFVAAAVWFSLVTWLMVTTKNFWDCVVAHAVTNLLLGIYVVASGNWWLM